MRTRIGNPHDEAHGNPMRVYDWIAPMDTKPADVVANAETALGVTLRGNTGTAHGYVSTSTRPDGSVYVCVHLYDTPCSDASHGHALLAVADDVTLRLPLMKTAIGESLTHKLGAGNDASTLKALGFKTAEEKLTARGSKSIVPLDAISAQCAECGTVAFTDGPLR